MTTLKCLHTLTIVLSVFIVTKAANPTSASVTGRLSSEHDCPSSGSKQIVYPDDCSKYYQCENGKKEVRSCPESLFFNMEIGSCDFLDNTSCQRPSVAPTKSTKSTTVTTPVPIKTTVNPNPDEDCPAIGAKQIPYPSDCSKYYQCHDGYKELKNCPESLFFNVEIESCDFLDNTACQLPTVATTKPTQTTMVTTPISPKTSEHPTAAPTKPTQTTTVVTTPISPKTSVNPNPDQDCPASGTKQIGFPSDCSKYYLCDNGRKELKDCPQSLFFNVQIGSCDFLDNTDCELPTAAPTKRPTAAPTKPTQTTIVTTPLSPKTSERPTAAPTKPTQTTIVTTTLSPKTSEPTQTTTVVTTSISPKTSVNPYPDQDCPASGTKQIGFPGDCSKYYLCDNGRKELKDCPQSLFFNVQIGSCDFLDNTDCVAGSTETSTISTTHISSTPTATTQPTPKPTQSQPTTAAATTPTPTSTPIPRTTKATTRPVTTPTQSQPTTAAVTTTPTLTSNPISPTNEDTASSTPTPTPDTTKATTPSTHTPTPDTTEATTPYTPTPTPDTTEATTPSTPTPTPDTTEATTPFTPAPTPDTTEATTPSTPAPTPDTTEATTPSTPTPTPDTTEATTAPASTPTPSQPTSATTPSTPTPTPDTTEATTLPVSTPTSSKPTTAATTLPTPTSTQIPTTTSGSVCYGHPEGAFVANPNDCSSFFECIKGNPRKFKCPLGTLWNDSIKKCDVEDNVDC